MQQTAVNIRNEPNAAVIVLFVDYFIYCFAFLDYAVPRVGTLIFRIDQDGHKEATVGC
jgi:hypothetical protein